MGAEDMSKLRLLHFVVQPVLLADDGDSLVPGPAVQPQPLTLDGLRDLAANWPEKLAEIEASATQAG
jgi:hypothetical protein